MKRFTFVAVVLTLGIPASTRAFQQTATSDEGKREFIVSGCLLSGCLLRNGYAGYAVEDNRVVAIDPHLDVKSLKTVASSCS